MPKLFVEYVGMGDSDKPKDYAYSTAERTDLVMRSHALVQSPLPPLFARQFVAGFEIPDDAIGLIALVARLKVMIADDRLGQAFDRSDRPKFAVPPHHAFRRVWRSRRKASFASHILAWMKKRSHSACNQIVASP